MIFNANFYVVIELNGYLGRKRKMDSDGYNDLPDSETNFEWQQIFDSLPDMIAIIGLDFKIKNVNKVMLDTLGVKSEDLVEGMLLFDALY